MLVHKNLGLLLLKMRFQVLVVRQKAWNCDHFWMKIKHLKNPSVILIVSGILRTCHFSTFRDTCIYCAGKAKAVAKPTKNPAPNCKQARTQNKPRFCSLSWTTKRALQNQWARLDGWAQRVVKSGVKSSWWPVASGVSKGSSFGASLV